ncbi:MAG: hypothetical protein IK083_04245 [Abditibacteriota bacterium]|nr:hypothetical protein [Abditibacteriota bacterium]
MKRITAVHGRRGSTLIEILVTIFVLTGGLFVLYGMYPQGFNILENARNINTAKGLIQTSISDLQSRAGNLPFAIVPCDDLGDPDGRIQQGNGTVKISALNPYLTEKNTFETDEDGNYKADGQGNYQRGSLLRSRKVVGEKTEIPGGDYVTTANGNLYGGKYTLLFSPIDTERDAAGKLVRFRIAGPEMTLIDDSATSQYPVNQIWTDAEFGCYFSEYDSRLYFAFLPSSVYTTMDYTRKLDYDRKYYVSYMVRNQTTGQVFRKEGGIRVKSDYDGRWSTLFYDYDENNAELNTTNLMDVGNGYVFLADTLKVKRIFEEVTDGSFGRDPYQFVMADPIVGTVVFNPLGHDLKFEADGRKTALTATIDYMIYDSRIIAQDFQFPASHDYDGSVKLKLHTGGILGVGSPTDITDGAGTDNPDEPTFEGLIRGAFDATGNVNLQLGHKISTVDELVLPQSVLIIDMATGLRVFPADEDASDISIDFGNGVINFRSSTVDLISWADGSSRPVYSDVDMSNRAVRVYYRTDNDWLVKFVKLPDSFMDNGKGEKNYNLNVDLNWDEYGIAANSPGRVYFPQVYAGLDVLVDYVDTDGNAVYGELQKISEFPEDNQSSCYIELKNDAESISNIRGSGINVGAYWRNNGKFRARDINFSIIGQ